MSNEKPPDQHSSVRQELGLHGKPVKGAPGQSSASDWNVEEDSPIARAGFKNPGVHDPDADEDAVEPGRKVVPIKDETDESTGDTGK